MEQVFLTVLNMSITGSYVILFVLITRMFLKKAPRIFSYSLWSMVLFRLICPFSFSSTLSFFGLFKKNTMEHIPANLGYMEQPQVNMGIDTLDNWVNHALPMGAPAASVNPMQVAIFVGSILWIIGVVGLLVYSAISYILLQKKVSTAMLASGKVFECEKIRSPFVLGIIKPKIYLPINLSQSEHDYIVMHEETHIKRFDYLIKPFAFLVLCVHWFNPLVWLSFMLMTRDMEMSCDERVLRKMGNGIKKDYSSSLLALAVEGNMIKGSPLAFGESNTKSRITNVLNYKKPAFWVVMAGIIVVMVVGIGLISNPKNHKQDLSFLNIKNTVSVVLQQEEVLIRPQGRGASLVSGDELGKFLDVSSNNWKEKKVPSLYELSPDLVVYINIASDHKINFYESEPDLAMVVFDGKHRYYEIPQDTYKKIYMMGIKSSYMIPEEIMNAVANGKRTKLHSVQDTPNNGDYKILEVGNKNYYIYQKGGKYYIERPYQFINEMSEEVYKDAISFAIQSEEAFLEFAQNEWEYGIEIDDKSISSNEPIEVHNSNFKIIYSARNSILASTQEEIFKLGQMSGEYRDHLNIVGIEPSNVYTTDGTVVTAFVYEFEDVEKGTKFKLELSDELRNRLGLEAETINILVK